MDSVYFEDLINSSENALVASTGFTVDLRDYRMLLKGRWFHRLLDPLPMLRRHLSHPDLMILVANFLTGSRVVMKPTDNAEAFCRLVSEYYGFGSYESELVVYETEMLLLASTREARNFVGKVHAWEDCANQELKLSPAVKLLTSRIHIEGDQAHITDGQPNAYVAILRSVDAHTVRESELVPRVADNAQIDVFALEWNVFSLLKSFEARSVYVARSTVDNELGLDMVQDLLDQQILVDMGV